MDVWQTKRAMRPFLDRGDWRGEKTLCFGGAKARYSHLLVVPPQSNRRSPREIVQHEKSDAPRGAEEGENVCRNRLHTFGRGKKRRPFFGNAARLGSVTLQRVSFFGDGVLKWIPKPPLRFLGVSSNRKLLAPYSI